MAIFRRQKRQEGFREATIWLSPEDEQAIQKVAEKLGVTTRADAIRMTMRKVADEELKM
ncbi:hypothetical protein [Phyllobacterium myrsinacearum]|uniref:DNA-binding GntR family transcriptional regulator n=1 Tax=Phyllobacterium myrsinacearum TaxID=28101 RepID=A0A839EMG3_9HYPH|nr:hypothetical protein [Phyllobacterium myrsinacearum]MBA8881763.1 DNA-binding GntR family transcriptional regulator [Phyllobacterium myrsinacearum]